MAIATRAIVRTERNHHHHVIVDILASAKEHVARLLSLSHSPFAYFAYISYFSPSFFTPKVILVLCDHRVRIFTAFVVDAYRYQRALDFSCPFLLTLKWPPMISPRNLPEWFGERVFCVPLVYLNYVITRTRSVRRVVVRYVLLILFVLSAKAGQLIFANYI